MHWQLILKLYIHRLAVPSWAGRSSFGTVRPLTLTSLSTVLAGCIQFGAPRNPSAQSQHPAQLSPESPKMCPKHEVPLQLPGQPQLDCLRQLLKSRSGHCIPASSSIPTRILFGLLPWNVFLRKSPTSYSIQTIFERSSLAWRNPTVQLRYLCPLFTRKSNHLHCHTAESTKLAAVPFRGHCRDTG